MVVPCVYAIGLFLVFMQYGCSLCLYYRFVSCVYAKVCFLCLFGMVVPCVYAIGLFLVFMQHGCSLCLCYRFVSCVYAAWLFLVFML